jgi:hypothetical protein
MDYFNIMFLVFMSTLAGGTAFTRWGSIDAYWLITAPFILGCLMVFTEKTKKAN